MKKTSFFALFAVAAGTLLGAASGCELIASVDRSKISEGGGGAGGAVGGGGAPTTTTGGTGGTMPGCSDPATDCTDPLSGDCKMWTCDAGACVEANVADGTDATTQTAGDCKKNVCMGGAAMAQDDNTDILDDMNDCTVDSCTAGSPTTEPAVMGAMCTGGSGKVCDGNGACVECNSGADCTDPLNPDCSAGNQCIPETCTDGMKNVDETDLDCGGPDCDPCDTGKLCNTATDCYHGVCDVGGTCAAPTCTDGVQNGGDYLMNNGETDLDCGGPCGATCGPNKVCDVNGDCVGNQCTGMGGTCVPNCSDQVKNNVETDVDCGGGTCGGCMVGQMCAMSDANCVPTAYCDMMVCAAKKAPGVACAATNQCAAGVCDMTDGVCCDKQCPGSCESCKLAGSAGTCTLIAAGQDPDMECAGTQVCDGSSTCVKQNGDTCSMAGECLSGNCVDGVCCNVACGGACQACNVAGTVGTCTNITAGQDPANECANGACNGSGACQKQLGDACGGAGECGSGFCADGVCCDAGCMGTCVACNLAGMVGACSNVPEGQDPGGECGGSTPNCSGMGTCGIPNGSACTNNNQCVSTFCADGVCCNSACGGDCQACNLAGTTGTCSNVMDGMTDTCTGGQTCMTGVCQ